MTPNGVPSGRTLITSIVDSFQVVATIVPDGPKIEPVGPDGGGGSVTGEPEPVAMGDGPSDVGPRLGVARPLGTTGRVEGGTSEVAMQPPSVAAVSTSQAARVGPAEPRAGAIGSECRFRR